MCGREGGGMMCVCVGGGGGGAYADVNQVGGKGQSGKDHVGDESGRVKGHME